MNLPHCDLITGEIYGCKKGSKLWWHEKGHFKFNRLPSTSSLKVAQDYMFAFWMLSISLYLLNKYMIWIVLPTMLVYLGIDLYEEMWCNKYAKSRINRNIHK